MLIELAQLRVRGDIMHFLGVLYSSVLRLEGRNGAKEIRFLDFGRVM
jgi:hypothetical protein